MRDRASRRRRSTRDLAGRIALASGIAVLGYECVTFSAAQVALATRPAFSDAVAGYDGRIGAAHAAALLRPPVTAGNRDRAEALSRLAVRRDPTAVVGVASLGLAVLSRGDTPEARHWLAYAQRLSRRNLQTQLWSIEDAVARGDVAGALRWYDVALRVKPALGDTLFPVLARAARDQGIRDPLIRTLAARPPWAASYVTYAARQVDDPQSAAALLVGLHRRGIAIPAEAQASVVTTLLTAGDVDQAWRYYMTIRPRAERSRSRDPRFTATLGTPTIFDWTVSTDNSIAGSIEPGRDGGAFDFSAPTSIGGPALLQMQVLPPGSYRLAGHSDGISQDPRTLPYWSLTCRDNGRELGRVVVRNSADAGGAFAGDLTVPADCPVQALSLIVQPSDAVGGSSGRIDRIVLMPAGTGAR